STNSTTRAAPNQLDRRMRPQERHPTRARSEFYQNPNWTDVEKHDVVFTHFFRVLVSLPAQTSCTYILGRAANKGLSVTAFLRCYFAPTRGSSTPLYCAVSARPFRPATRARILQSAITAARFMASSVRHRLT